MPTFSRSALILCQTIGLLLSAMLVAVTFANPKQVEHRLKDFAITKVVAAADEVWQESTDELANSDTAAKLQALSNRFGLEQKQAELDRRRIVTALIAASVSPDCVENCEFWIAAAGGADSMMLRRIADLKVGQTTVQDFIVGRYHDSVQGLIRDLRRFGLVNTIALSLMIGLVLLRNYLNWQLVTFSVTLTGYIIWASYGYIFTQNWALAIIFQDWAAPGYQVCMILVSLFLFDWLFLRGRITELISSAISSVAPG